MSNKYLQALQTPIFFFIFYFFFHNLYILLMSSNEGYADFSTGISLLLLIIFPTAVIKLVAL